jgi:hypothetical protein
VSLPDTPNPVTAASGEVVLLRPSVLWGKFFTIARASQPAACRAPANGIVFAKWGSLCGRFLEFCSLYNVCSDAPSDSLIFADAIVEARRLFAQV